MSTMTTIEDAMSGIMEIDGALGGALVDYESGMSLGTIGGGLNLEVAAAGNSEVMRAKFRTLAGLGLTDSIEDILITLTTQYHLIRPLQGRNGPQLFIYCALDRSRANLALARHHLRRIEAEIEI